MTITLPLDKMTQEEKIHAMEALWDDLCARSDDLMSPAWHGDLLAEREEAIQRGDERFEDWDLVKKEIRKRIG